MKITQCRVCRGKLSEPKIDLGSTPLANEFLDTQEKQEIFPLQVCVCEKCGHYQLNESIDPERLFRHYVYVAGTSAVNVEHFRQYAIHMVEKFDLKPGNRVLDIASNDGILLQHFKDLGLSVLGIDPARNLAEEATRNGIPTIPEFFTEDRAELMLTQHEKFDLITANNVFAHVPDLIDFTKGVKKLLSDNGVFSFEVSYFGDVCDHVLFDTIYHEHSSYHTITPLISFFKTHGLDLFQVERLPNHGGSIRVFVRHWINELLDSKEMERKSSVAPRVMDEERMNQRVEKLALDVKLLGSELCEKLQGYKNQGKSIAIYGTPAKATTLMYALGIRKEWIDFTVDDNPLKQGTFTPGLKIPVLSSTAILEKEPDVVLILAWNFAPSIIEKCKKEWREYKFQNRQRYGMYKYPTFITPLPELKVERYCEDQTCTCGIGPFTNLPGNETSFRCGECGGVDSGIPVMCKAR